jgi:spermidine/putrescine transport system substrate-binding protein
MFRRLSTLLSLTFVVLAFAGVVCSPTLSAAEKSPVTVYMYSEYIDPAVPAEFEKATGYPLRIEVYETAEDMLAKLRSGAVNQYDVVVATDAYVVQMIKLNLVKKLDQAKIPNSKNVDAQFKSPSFDPGNAYSYPYQWGTVGMIYDTAKAPAGAKPSWSWLFDAKTGFGPFYLMDEARPQFGIALKHGGASLNSRDPKTIKSAVDLLIATKGNPKCVGFAGGVDGKNKVLAGEATGAVVYNGDAVRAMGEKATLAYSTCEGSNIWVDVLLMTSQAPNPEGANAFINYVLDGKVAAQISNFNRYATPVAAAMPFITPADKANAAIYPDAATMKTLEYLEDLGKDTRLHAEAWTAIKSR